MVAGKRKDKQSISDNKQRRDKKSKNEDGNKKMKAKRGKMKGRERGT